MDSEIAETLAVHVDRISALPDDIITNNILSLLPTRDSVRTSALSTRWKHLYASVPVLYFQRIGGAFIGKVLNTVTKTLACISKFSIHNLTPTHSYDLVISSWIETVVSHSVQVINLSFYLADSAPLMPPSLFTCETLVSLGLNVNFVLSVPENVRLPKLKKLFLMNTIMRDESNDEAVRRLFSSCPVLECLTVFSLKMHNHRVFDVSVPSLKILNVSLLATDGELLINCPNLELLHCISYPARGFSGDVLGFLKKCYIEVQLTELQLKEGKVIELIKQVCKVQFLSLAGDSMQALLSPPCSLPTFENLTHLELMPNHSKGWLLLSSMLESSPRLETLVFPVGFFDRDDYDGVSFSPPEKVPNCLSLHLKVIRINRFLGDEDEYKLVEYFLTNALVLERMEICPWSSEGLEEENDQNEEAEEKMAREEEEREKEEGEAEEDGEFESDLELNFEITRRLLIFQRFSEVCQIVLVSSQEKKN